MVVKTETLEEKARELLKERGVTVEDIAQLVMFLQKDYISDLTLADCTESVNSVLTKREEHNAIITGIQLDILAEKKKLMSPLQHIIEDDEGLYGIDEILALSIVNVYGTIGFTNYGYIDKVKPGILKELNSHDGVHVHTSTWHFHSYYCYTFNVIISNYLRKLFAVIHCVKLWTTYNCNLSIHKFLMEISVSISCTICCY